MRSVTDAVPLILWALDNEGVFTLSQGRTLKKLGLEPGQVVGQSVFEIYRDYPQIAQFCQRALAGEAMNEIHEIAGRTFVVHVAPHRDIYNRQIGIAGISYDITEQTQVSQALRESEARFERIVSNVPGVVFRSTLELDGSGKFLYVSQGCRELLGVEPADLLADSQVFLDLVAPHQRERLPQSFFDAARDMTPWEMDIEVILPSGQQRWVRATARPERREDGVVFWDGLVLDLTQNVRAKTALNQSRRALAEAQQLSRIGSFTYELETEEIVWSDEMYRLFGVAPGWKPTFERVMAFYHPDDRDAADARIADVIENGGASGGVVRVVRADGEIRYMEARTRMERDFAGKGARLVGSLQDVTERVEAERALRESEERYALAARGTNDGLWDWNLKTDVIYFSPRWKEMIGCGDEIGDSPRHWFDRVHPDDLEALRVTLAAHLNGESEHFECQYRVRGCDDRYYWMLGRGLALLDEGGHAVRITGSQTDISDRKRAEVQLQHNAYYDDLTGLPNRALFAERLQHTISRGNRQAELSFAVLFLDIDHFKKINDSLGHLAGDRLLVDAAQRFARSLRPGDTVARLGGDEFAILLDDLQSIEDVNFVAERIHRELEQPFGLDGHEVFVTVSMGIAPGQGGESVAEELLRNADTAMYRAKGAGRARHKVFEATMHQRAVKMLELETDLWYALERDELRLHYQPIISLDSGRICGFEALARWQHPQRGLVSPGEFIPLAEESGLIVPIGWWVLNEACRQAQAWQREFGAENPLWMSVNLSSKQLAQGDMTQRVQGALEHSGLPGELLKLEITESVIMEHTESAAEILQSVKSLGVALCIDDFGTGYSSLSYLHRFPLDTIKVDRSFISQMATGARPKKIVNTIVSMASGLGMNVVAEGVENPQQLEILRQMQCGYAQGFFISRPQPATQTKELLQENSSW